MTTRASLNQQPAIYDGDLQVRLDAAMARPEGSSTGTHAIRASVRAPFTPFCMYELQQLGRPHESARTVEQYYI